MLRLQQHWQKHVLLSNVFFFVFAFDFGLPQDFRLESRHQNHFGIEEHALMSSFYKFILRPNVKKEKKGV
jgi:hypothetical protein